LKNTSLLLNLDIQEREKRTIKTVSFLLIPGGRKRERFPLASQDDPSWVRGKNRQLLSV